MKEPTSKEFLAVHFREDKQQIFLGEDAVQLIMNSQIIQTAEMEVEQMLSNFFENPNPSVEEKEKLINEISQCVMDAMTVKSMKDSQIIKTAEMEVEQMLIDFHRENPKPSNEDMEGLRLRTEEILIKAGNEVMKDVSPKR
jgi:hypothetical protein